MLITIHIYTFAADSLILFGILSKYIFRMTYKNGWLFKELFHSQINI